MVPLFPSLHLLPLSLSLSAISWRSLCAFVRSQFRFFTSCFSGLLAIAACAPRCCMLHAARCACTVTFFVFSQFGCKSSPASLQSAAASFCSLMSSYFRVIIFYSVIKRVCAAQTTSMARLRARPRPRPRENPQQMCEVRAMCVWGILNRISVI